MTPPSRTLGVAFSDDDRISHAAGAVVRADGALDGLAFDSCTVGGADATDAVLDLAATLDRPDARHICLAGVAPAWFNLLDLPRIHDALDRPVYAVSYEASPGLEPALRDAFDGDALERRLSTYRSLPSRRRVGAAADGEADGDSVSEPLFVRAVGIDIDAAAAAVSASVRDGFRRPEPLRIASIAASARRDALA